MRTDDLAAEAAAELRPGARGRYRRAVRVAIHPHRATAEMEDDVHHFRVTLEHDGAVVTAAHGEAIRAPYTTCPGALGQLARLHGLPLAAVVALPAPERFEQCMHLHDIAAAAARHAPEPGFERMYRIEVDHDPSRPLARIRADGAELLRWSIEDGRIVGPPFDGIAFRDLDAALGRASPELAEAARLLRRASLISFVRRYDWGTGSGSRGVEPSSPANCYAKQPVRRGEARLDPATHRDFFAAGRWPLDGGAPVPPA